MLSVGGGYSNISEYYAISQINNELPELSATVDYLVIPEYSIGASISYQNVRGSGYYTNYGGGSVQYTETISRYNIGIRSLVYFNKSARPGFYGGVRLGYQQFVNEYNPTNPYNNGYPVNNEPKNEPTIQAFVGVRAAITPGFSTYFELGTGNPYFAEMGFSFNFGGRPAASSATPPASQNTGSSAPYVR